MSRDHMVKDWVLEMSIVRSLFLGSRLVLGCLCGEGWHSSLRMGNGFERPVYLSVFKVLRERTELHLDI